MMVTKRFNVGDKVFAKVKGYPPWPARVMEDLGKKCNVRFYGTGETGLIKVENMFYYIKNKDKYLKPLKRKDYKDAIEQIETDIIEDGGTDGNKNDSPDDSKSLIKDTSFDLSDAKKQAKRSHSNISESSDEEPNKKKTRNSPNTSEAASTEDDSENIGNKENIESSSDAILRNDEEDIENKMKVTEITSDNESDTETDVENKTDETLSTTSLLNNNVNGVSPKYTFTTVHRLNKIVAYAKYVQSNKDLYKDKPVEERNDTDDLLAVKLPNGKFVGLKYYIKLPNKCDSELEVAQYEGEEAKKILQLQKYLQETGAIEDHLDKIVELDITEEEITNILKKKFLILKQVKLDWFKVETRLLALDAKIRASLGLDKAYPKQALECLKLLNNLKIEPLMLRKHPHVVDMVKRLRRYMGNVKEWNMQEDELNTFQEDAEGIRTLADEVYEKYKDICNIHADNFWDKFHETVEEFKKQIKNLTDKQQYSLRFEPNSRRAFLDEIDLDVDDEKKDENDYCDDTGEGKAKHLENMDDITNSLKF